MTYTKQLIREFVKTNRWARVYLIVAFLFVILGLILMLLGLINTFVPALLPGSYNVETALIPVGFSLALLLGIFIFAIIQKLEELEKQ